MEAVLPERDLARIDRQAERPLSRLTAAAGSLLRWQRTGPLWNLGARRPCRKRALPCQSVAAFDKIQSYHPELTAIRRDLHANPELGLEVHRTADIVARQLEAWGIEVHREVGGSGVVGVLRNGNGQRAIGLRADMDALPIIEATGASYASRVPGKMHACGHDGHTAILLGAARYLAETRDFNGTVNFIFQPGEEGAGGALAMLDDGLFQRFPCDRITAHNRPGAPVSGSRSPPARRWPAAPSSTSS
jgi:metal-dependent amidase/aminoacylase/carboxypeptidase family protein